VLCAHTIRRLKDGSFDRFAEGFMPSDQNPPPGWLRFHMLRSLQNPNEVVTFGFFDGTLEELNRSQESSDYQSRRDTIDQYVDEVVVNGIYEIVATRSSEG
jgi:hypothetical protein